MPRHQHVICEREQPQPLHFPLPLFPTSRPQWALVCRRGGREGSARGKARGEGFFAPINFAAAPRRLSLSEASDCKQAAKKETLDSLSLAPGNFSSCPFDAAAGGGRGERGGAAEVEASCSWHVPRRARAHSRRLSVRAGSARSSTALIRDCTQPAPRVAIAPVPTTGGRPSVSLGSSAPAEPSVMMTVAMDEHRAHLSTVKASGPGDISSVKIVLIEWC